MANARANIYPIQLQGAELNLNKFDGEIKQYSGFNKNNSPFVGGGLSPIFRKDETVEGATNKNTYIAPNGDVYRVTTEGLFKNDELLQRYTSGCIYWNKRKIETESDVLFCYSDKFKVHYRGSYLYLNDIQICDVELQGFEDINDFRISMMNGIFDTLDGVRCFIFVHWTERAVPYLRIKIFNADTGVLISSKSIEHSSGVVDKTKPIDILKATDGGYLVIGYREVYTVGTISKRRTYASFFDINLTNYHYTFDSTTEMMLSVSNLPSSSSMFSTFVRDFQVCSFPFNKFYASKISNINSNTNLAYGFTLKTIGYENAAIKITVAQADILTLGSNVTDADAYNTFLEEDINNLSKNSLIKPYILQFKTADNKIHYACINCSNNVSLEEKTLNNTTLKRAVHNATGLKMNFGSSKLELLINNGQFSGLSTLTGILLTDWNSIDITDIVLVNNTTICFKERNNFYLLYNGNPILQKTSNLIITNVDEGGLVTYNRFYNCYFINENILGWFAPSYNLFLPFGYDEDKYFISSDNNNYWVAASVNEYELQHNASILINPVNIFIPSRVLYYRSNKLPGDKTAAQPIVNYYGGDDSSVIYRQSYYNSMNSSAWYHFIDQDLVGLPYPTDTNGNVQYSPSLFSEIKDIYGNDAFIKSGGNFYPLMKYNNETVMSFYLASGIEGLQEGFIVQGQFYGIINNGLYSLRYNNGVVEGVDFVVSVEGLKFCGNTPYQAFFFSKTNRCLYIFNGANVLQQSQFIDIYADIKFYKYNPATHSIFMVTDDCVLVFSSFGTFRLDVPNVEEIYLLENGIVLLNNVGTFMRIKYYNTENGYTKQNVILETCFYGMNNQTVTINDCLYMRLFSEEHESGDIEVRAVTLANEGKKTERTTFKIKPCDWDKETHSIYLRYQPKEQRGLGISFKINSPFKICSLSVGSIADSILIDKVSKGAINAPYNNKSSIEEW